MKERSASKGFLVLSIAGILSKIISVFYIPLLQRILGLSGYGIYQNCYEVFLFAYAITNLGTQPAIAKVVAEFTAIEKPYDAIRTLTISKILLALVGGFLSILLMIFAFPLGRLIGNPGASYGILMLAPSIFITSILSSYRGYFQGRSSMTAIAVSQVLEQVVNIIVSLTCAFLLGKITVEYGAAGGTIGTSIGAVLACMYMVYKYKKADYEETAYKEQEHEKRIKTKSIVKRLIKYGLPITLSAGLQNFGSLVDMVNVNSRLAHAGFTLIQSQELYGVLGRYKTLLSVPLIIVTALASTALPAVSAAMALKNRKEARNKASFAYKITFFITIPAAMGLSVLSSEVFTLLYGTSQGYELMLMGSIVLVLMGVVQIQTTVLQSMNELYFVLKTFCIGIVLKIIANFILVGITDINIKGVIVGNFLWFLVPMILNQLKLRKSLRVKIGIFDNVFLPLIASIIMGVTIYLIKRPLAVLSVLAGGGAIFSAILTFIMISIGGFIYLYLIILFGGITKKDVQSVSPKVYGMLPRFLRKIMK